MRSYITLLLTALALARVPLSAAGQPVEVAPSAPRQGEALFVRVTADGVEEPRAAWRNDTYELRRAGNEWLAVLPISPDTPARPTALRVTYTQHGVQRAVHRTIPIGRTAYPVQHLKMATSISYLYTYPGAKREDAAIRKATRTLSDELLWDGAPWRMPTTGRFSTPFGVRRIRNGKAVGRHRGLDIAAKTGTPVYAPAAGRVTLAGAAKSFKKYGNTVVLDHGMGVTSLYIHMSALLAKEGQLVKKGQLIGKVGSLGVATGPHLHWQVYVHGDTVNPLFFTKLTQRGVAI